MDTERADSETGLREPSFPWWFRSLIGSLGIAVFGVAVLRRPISDPDTFWHIRAGQWLPRTWQFVGPEPWSTASSRPWVLHEWLPELLMGWVASWAGLAGISWSWAGGVVLVGVAVWFVCRQRAFTALAGLLTIATLLAMSGSLTPRPHLVSFALAALFTHTWLCTLDDLRPRWWLVPASWVWACSHGMWFVGPAIGVAVLVGGLLDQRIPKDRTLRLASLIAATAAVGALTPVGPRLLLAPFHVGEYTQFVAEWQPAALLSPQMIAFLTTAAAVVVTWARSRRRVLWTHILVLAVAVGLALLYARTVAVGAAVLAPLAASTLQALLPVRREPVTSREVVVLAVTCAVALGGAGFLRPGGLGEQDGGPEAIVGDIAALAPGTVVCNDYDIGGWFLWRFPDLRPTVDGRAEVYSVEHIRASVDFLVGGPGWHDYVEDSNCSAALVATDAPVVEDLHRSGWATAAQSEDYILLVEP